MKFLVDAPIPPGICALLQSAGHDVLHTRQLPVQNQTPDQVINDLSVGDQRVVISKDTDFYYSHLLLQRPHKLLLIRTANIRTRELKAIFDAHLAEIVQALEANSLVELDRSKVRMVA
jgi:predicted nuclease of predicted toxin-antitoxin system